MAKRNDETKQNNSENSSQTAQDSGSTNSGAPAYLTAAARLSTSRPLGASRTDKDVLATVIGTEEQPTYVSETDAVPGFMVLDYMPTLGISKSANSPLNRATFYEFNRIREKISGNRSYEPVDHMIYRQCVDGLRELYAYIKRAYCIIRTYNALNIYRPREIMKGMHLDFDAWNNAAPVVYQWLCNHKSALTPFPTVPIGRISDRREAFNSAIFLDGDSPTAQSYIFNQVGFYSYEVVDTVRGISLARPADGTPQGYFDLWDKLYVALQSSSDVYTMAADIRRAFEGNVITDLIPPTAEEEVVYIKLDPVLTSIMNATTLATYEDETQMDEVMTQVANALRIKDGGNGVLICMGNFSIRIPSKYGTDIPALVHTTGFLSHLNFVESEPDTNAIVNAVRFKPVLTNDFTTYKEDGTNYQLISTCELSAIGTEAIISARCYQIVAGALQAVAYPSTVTLYRNSVAKDVVNDLAMASNFDWLLPMFYCHTESADRAQVTELVEDTQNYVPITKDILMQLHEAILLAEFNIPG